MKAAAGGSYVFNLSHYLKLIFVFKAPIGLSLKTSLPIPTSQSHHHQIKTELQVESDVPNLKVKNIIRNLSIARNNHSDGSGPSPKQRMSVIFFIKPNGA